MRKHAVLLTIIFAFIVTLSSVTFTFVKFFQLNKQQYNNNIFMKYSVITQIYREHMQRNTSSTMLEANLAVYDLTPINNKIHMDNIIKLSNVLKKEGFKTLTAAFMFKKQQIIKKEVVQDMRATMLEFNGSVYFFIESWKGGVLLKDSKLKPYVAYPLIVAYITIVSMIFLSFFLILVRIKPLRRLRAQIARFGSGDMDISFRMKGADEIALLANELENTRLNINSLIESRTLFLRNIMHELKTPIAKGRISSEMVENPKQKERFKSIFLRLENLINEFALIEEVSSGFEQTEKLEYRLLDLIDGAIDMAMIDSERANIFVNGGKKLEVDYKLFSTAIKNMIDNAMKYSTDKKITIRTNGDEICFDSYGDKLTHPLSFYVEPFTKEHPSRDSFGLGLYLVDTILKVHGMVLAYEYNAGRNRFIFVPYTKEEDT